MISIGIAVVALVIACDFIAAEGLGFAAFNTATAFSYDTTNSESPGSAGKHVQRMRREVKALGLATYQPCARGRVWTILPRFRAHSSVG